MQIQVTLTPDLLKQLASGVQDRLWRECSIPNTTVSVTPDPVEGVEVTIDIQLPHNMSTIDYDSLSKIKVAFEPQGIYIDCKKQVVELTRVSIESLGIEWRF